MNASLKKKILNCDLCVVGGGLSGSFAALATARHGAKVVVMQDRPMLGGNASSEIRMWISGAGTRVRDLQETGLMEELLLENMHRNPKRNFSIWDSILYEKVRFEPNIDLILNCTCTDATAENGMIKSVKGFQLTTYLYHEVEAKIFVDSSGDSILAPLCDAEFRIGREANTEFNEDSSVDKTEKKKAWDEAVKALEEYLASAEYIDAKTKLEEELLEIQKVLNEKNKVVSLISLLVVMLKLSCFLLY